MSAWNTYCSGCKTEFLDHLAVYYNDNLIGCFNDDKKLTDAQFKELSSLAKGDEMKSFTLPGDKLMCIRSEDDPKGLLWLGNEQCISLFHNPPYTVVGMKNVKDQKRNGVKVFDDTRKAFTNIKS